MNYREICTWLSVSCWCHYKAATVLADTLNVNALQHFESNAIGSEISEHLQQYDNND
jgi:hypothetical protein